MATTTPTLTVRTAHEADADPCGRIMYDAFASIAARHGFPPEPPSAEFTAFLMHAFAADPGHHGVVAERDGVVVASAWADERGPIVGIGPVTVDPGAQDAGIGRALMRALLDRERDRGAAGVRLVQTGYHARSFALYTSLGFVVREALSVVGGDPPHGATPRDRRTRPATPNDAADANALTVRVHGHDRARELADATAEGGALVVTDEDGRLTGYATGLGYPGHAVGETNADLEALLAAPEGYVGIGVLVPSRNHALLAWSLQNGLRVVQQNTLMTTGLYNEPAGTWLPSILF